ncbi:MAG TPA: RNA polymerase sigma factor [Vicinamibacterales bacterium]|nr:RNA polymerase sigma factor [Vicinamibacterales bacterium]
MDDTELIQRMRSGDEHAFDEFFNAFFPRLFRFAVRRLGNEDAAEDVVQAALVSAMRKIASWRGEAALFTWLCTICRHEMSAYWTRTGRQPVTLPLDDHPDTRAELESLAHDGAGPHAELERHDLSDRVRLTLDHLPRPYGEVLAWKYIEGLSVAEIAERLGSTAKAAESMLTRARVAFRDGFQTLAGEQS